MKTSLVNECSSERVKQKVNKAFVWVSKGSGKSRNFWDAILKYLKFLTCSDIVEIFKIRTELRCRSKQKKTQHIICKMRYTAKNISIWHRKLLGVFSKVFSTQHSFTKEFFPEPCIQRYTKHYKEICWETFQNKKFFIGFSSLVAKTSKINFYQHL